MKKIISWLSLALVLALLACSFVSCGPKSNMRDMAKAIVDGTVDASLVNIEKIVGTESPDGFGYFISGTHDYTENVYKLEGREGSYMGAKRSAKLDQTTKDIEIKAGSESEDYRDYSKIEIVTNLIWSFDAVDDTEAYIDGYVKYTTKNIPTLDDEYFYVEYYITDLTPFTGNVNSEEPYFKASDLENVVIDRYEGSDLGTVEGCEGKDLDPVHLALLVDFINRDLAKLVKVCEDAGYPVVINE